MGTKCSRRFPLSREFEDELNELRPKVQDAILARAILLELGGPLLGRPHADTFARSRYANMKELRCNAVDGDWRISFAFAPSRKAILLVARDK